MAFTSVPNENNLMAEGEYECILHSCDYGETKAGNPCIKFDFVVRSDVEQRYKGKHIFKNFYPDRETGEYDNSKIGKYASALGIPTGDPFELVDLEGCCCIVKIKHFTGDDGTEHECIFYCKPTEAGEKIQQLEYPATQDADFAMLNEDYDDLPF